MESESRSEVSLVNLWKVCHIAGSRGRASESNRVGVFLSSSSTSFFFLENLLINMCLVDWSGVAVIHLSK